MGLIMQNGISYGGVDIVKLTQAEYDALPESKNSDGILYAITDGESSSSGSGTSKPIELTKAQYEALGESTKTDGILYAIIDGDELSAKNMAYDGSVTGLGNNVQDAIDELNSNLVAEDGTPFRFVVNENGEYGYVVTDEEGADTVIPFSRLGEWSARKSSKVGNNITIGENKHTLFTLCTGPSGDVYACIFDLKNMKIVYKNDIAGVIAESYVDGVVKTGWSDGDTDTSTFYYLCL